MMTIHEIMSQSNDLHRAVSFFFGPIAEGKTDKETVKAAEMFAEGISNVLRQDTDEVFKYMKTWAEANF